MIGRNGGYWEGKRKIEDIFLFSISGGILISLGQCQAPVTGMIQKGFWNFQPWLSSNPVKCSSHVNGKYILGSGDLPPLL